MASIEHDHDIRIPRALADVGGQVDQILAIDVLGDLDRVKSHIGQPVCDDRGVTPGIGQAGQLGIVSGTNGEGDPLQSVGRRIFGHDTELKAGREFSGAPLQDRLRQPRQVPGGIVPLQQVRDRMGSIEDAVVNLDGLFLLPTRFGRASKPELPAPVAGRKLCRFVVKAFGSSGVLQAVESQIARTDYQVHVHCVGILGGHVAGFSSGREHIVERGPQIARAGFDFRFLDERKPPVRWPQRDRRFQILQRFR